MRPLAALVALWLAALPGCGGGDDTRPDAQPGEAADANTAVAMELVQAPGFGLVLTYCVTCHGPRQFLQQRGDRATWLGLIRWMQRDHGMQPLPDGVEDPLVDYLAKHYGPEYAGRRKHLRPDLLPPNPYAR